MTEWSAPDERGIRTRVLYVKPKRRISGERHRAAIRAADAGQVVLDDAHRTLLRDLLRRFKGAWRWNRILRVAGEARVELAYSLVSVLLAAGYVDAVERRDARGWQPYLITPLTRRELQRLAGLPDDESMQASLEVALRYAGETTLTQQLRLQLDTGRIDIRLRRALLLSHLDRWLAEKRTGTRRDFALLATGETKGIEDADWRWLEANDVLEPAGIVEHAPLLLVGGMVSLSYAAGQRLDIAAANGPLGLPAAALTHVVTAPSPTAWVIIENRTVFDRACTLPATTGLLWVPGHAPHWWLEAVSRLLHCAPAPTIVACDPDPAGIEIAARLLALWEDRGLAWQLAGMDGGALDALPARRALSPWDRDALSRLSGLPPALESLRQALLDRGAKGEQEGFFDDARLRTLLNPVT